jgi:hypothetical protein
MTDDDVDDEDEGGDGDGGGEDEDAVANDEDERGGIDGDEGDGDGGEDGVDNDDDGVGVEVGMNEGASRRSVGGAGFSKASKAPSGNGFSQASKSSLSDLNFLGAGMLGGLGVVTVVANAVVQYPGTLESRVSVLMLPSVQPLTPRTTRLFLLRSPA